MIERLIENTLKLLPEGQTIISITQVRESAIIVTDFYVYQARPADQPFGFVLYRIGALA